MTSACVPDLLYVPDFISAEEEADTLVRIDGERWLNDLRRRVQHYGYRYDYRSRVIDVSMRLGPIPGGYCKFGSVSLKEGFPRIAGSSIINEYEPGQGIRDHVDCEPCFGRTIVSVSLGATCVMNFTHKVTKQRIGFLLERRSALVLQGRARYEWLHGIPARKTDVWLGRAIKRERRVSLTFRQVIVGGLANGVETTQ